MIKSPKKTQEVDSLESRALKTRWKKCSLSELIGADYALRIFRTDTTDLKVWREYWKQHDANVVANNNKRFATILTAILQDIRSEAFGVELLDDPVVSMFSVEHAFEKGMGELSRNT